jgi:energy-coupling factor transport system permease protein
MPMQTGGPALISYVDKDSPLHRVDAISKLAAVIILGVTVMLSNSNLALFMLLVLVLVACLGVARVPFRQFRRGFGVLLFFAGGICLTQILWNQSGDVLFTVLGRPVTEGGVRWGIEKGLTICNLGLTSFTFVWTTNPRETVAGLVHFGLKYRFAWGVFLVLRYGPLFEHEYRVIREAQEVRGRDVSAGRVRGRLQMLKRYTMPLLFSMVRKTTNIAIAMDSRAFGAYPTRTFRDAFAWSRSGLILMAALVVLSIALLLTGGAFSSKNPNALG